LVVTRSQSGLTITELVVSAILIGYTLAVIGELVSLNTYASTKLTNKVDGQVGCSRAIRRIGEDVRMGRMIGNIYSISNHGTFPDISNPNDPSNLAPIGGWPSSPWPAQPYQLGPQTLIIQQPAVFQDPINSQNPLNGFPLRLSKDSIASGVPSYPMEYVDTVVYQIVPDSSNLGQFILQVARFSGSPTIAGSTLRPPLNAPQTVLTGIVGPMDPSNTNAPAVFQYLNSSTGSTVITSPTTAQAVGVSVNIEARVPSTTTGANLEITAGHIEFYLRTSRNLRLTNEY
jgi:hypothetical protein